MQSHFNRQIVKNFRLKDFLLKKLNKLGDCI